MKTVCKYVVYCVLFIMYIVYYVYCVLCIIYYVIFIIYYAFNNCVFLTQFKFDLPFSHILLSYKNLNLCELHLKQYKKTGIMF